MEEKTYEFCKNRKCCPTVSTKEGFGIVKVGGEVEGFTLWSRDQFRDFVSAAKDGHFDDI